MYVGYLAFFLSTFCFAAGDALVKASSDSVALPDIVLFRTAAMFLVGLTIARFSTPAAPNSFTWAFRPVHIARSLSFILAILAIIEGVRRLPLSQVHALLALAPVLTVLLSTVVLGERVTRLFWLLCLGSFSGVLLIVSPGFGTFQSVMLIPLAAAVLMSVYTITTKTAGRQVSMAYLLVHTGLAGVIASVATLGVSSVGVFDERLLILVAIGVLGAAAQLLLIAGLKRVDAARLQPLAYCLYLWAVIFDFAMFGIRSDLGSLVGGAIIVLCGIGVVILGRAELRKSG